jgi:hypothetical protein
MRAGAVPVPQFKDIATQTPTEALEQPVAVTALLRATYAADVVSVTEITVMGATLFLVVVGPHLQAAVALAVLVVVLVVDQVLSSFAMQVRSEAQAALLHRQAGTPITHSPHLGHTTPGHKHGSFCRNRRKQHCAAGACH